MELDIRFGPPGLEEVLVGLVVLVLRLAAGFMFGVGVDVACQRFTISAELTDPVLLDVDVARDVVLDQLPKITHAETRRPVTVNGPTVADSLVSASLEKRTKNDATAWLVSAGTLEEEKRRAEEERSRREAEDERRRAEAQAAARERADAEHLRREGERLQRMSGEARATTGKKGQGLSWVLGTSAVLVVLIVTLVAVYVWWDRARGPGSTSVPPTSRPTMTVTAKPVVVAPTAT